VDLHVLALRRTLDNEVISNRDAQAKILAKKFFPGRGEVLQPEPYINSVLIGSELIS
jgi:hypothetical protein